MTTNQMAARENKDLIRGAFAVWVNGHGDVFDLLADDVRGTITGSDRRNLCQPEAVPGAGDPATLGTTRPTHPTDC
jgi:hypothetical protein